MADELKDILLRILRTQQASDLAGQPAQTVPASGPVASPSAAASPESTLDAAPPEDRAHRLRSLYASLQVRHAFVLGQVVRWKPGLRNKLRPLDNAPAIVLEVLPNPRFDDSEPIASPYHMEPLDIRLGLLGEDGQFVSYLFDSRRFEPY